MTITTSSYTTNSLRINIANETSSTNIIGNIQLGMAKGGWTLYDITTASITAGSIYSPITTLVYSAPNADGFTTKYMIIRIDTVKLVLYTSACESWNPTTHIATNETWSGGGVFQQGFDIKDSIILVSATQRHCVIWTFIKSEPSFWSGVFEFERVAGEDSATVSPVPNWAWTNSLMLGTPYGQDQTTTNSPIMFAFCRTADGFTGARAAQVYAPVTNRGMFPPQYLTASVVTTLDPNRLYLASYANSANSGTVTYGWDPLKTVVSPVSADAITKYMPMGRAYNVGVTKPIGGALDTVFVNLDSTGGWPSASGPSTESLLLPLNGGSDYPFVVAYNTGTTSFYGLLPAATTATKVLTIGNNIWIGTNQGIYTYDQTLGQGGSPTLRVPHNVSGGVLDIVFDGARTVYGSLSNGIVAVDTELFTTSTINTIVSGTSYLSIDGRYVYGSSRTALTLPWCFSFSRTNFVTSSSFQVSSSTVQATGFGVPMPDYQGNVYLASQAGIVSGFVNKIIAKYASDTGVGSSTMNPKFYASWPTGATTVAVSNSPTSWYMDYTTFNTSNGTKPYLFVSGDTTIVPIGGAIYEFTPGTLTTSTYVSWPGRVTGVICNASAGTVAGTYDYRGDLNIVPIRGTLWVSPKKVGVVTPTGFVSRIIPNSPMGVSGVGNTPLPGATVVQTTDGTAATGVLAAPGGWAGSISTNGVRLFASFTNAINGDNRIIAVTGLYNVAYNSAGFAGAGRLTVKG